MRSAVAVRMVERVDGGRSPAVALYNATKSLATAACCRTMHKRAQTSLLRVALVGAPNAGKSTMFNRLTRVRKHNRRKQRGRDAIVDRRPGITRDRREGVGRLAELSFTLVDTPGLEVLPGQQNPRQPQRLARLARRGAMFSSGRCAETANDGEGQLWQAVAAQTALAVGSRVG